MSRHSRGNESAPRRSRRRVEEPSITEWLDSGSYGPYAADANRGRPEEPVSTELPPPYEPPPPPAYEPPAANEPPAPYDTGSYGTSSYGPPVDAAPPSYGTGSYGTSSYGTASVDPAPPAYNTGSYGASSYGTGSGDVSPPASGGSYGAAAYGTGSADPGPASHDGSYRTSSAYHTQSSADGTGSSHGVQSTEDSSTYGAHASHGAGSYGSAAGSTSDSRAESFLAPPAYERPADRYRSIPGVTDPNRPAPGEYGLRPAADPPMADYLTRPPMPDPPAPVRRPTTPIPSAARSRKTPKEPPRPPVNRAGRLRLRVNPIACDGHGLCAELLPEIVSLDDWGYPMPVVAEVPAELEGHAQRAAQQCPTLAIILERRQPRTR